MKRTLSKRLKKSVSAILAAAMSLSLFTAIPVSADIGRTTYNYDGYSVNYNVTNEWDGAQTVELTVSNTGTDSILNWALKYDAEGEISNLWNADLYEQNGDEYVIKNVGWNFEIAPNQSVTYGYTLSGNDITLPDSFEIYSKRVDKTEGYDVQYNITKSWDTGVEGNIVITNTSSAPIEAWTLSFDSNFTVDNLWNGRVLENNGTSYTVAAEMWTNPVQPNGSMTIGFVGSRAADVEALLSNFRLTEVVVGEGMPVIPIDPPVDEIEITANAVYNEESGNISVSWTSNKQDGTFDILISDNGENFVSVGIVEGVSEFVYTPESEFETLYFKVVQTVDELTAESNVVAVTKSAENIVILAEASYDKESGEITLSWTSNKENGTFEVFVSEDGENFTSVDTVEDVTEFIYSPNDEFEVLYFKVKQTIGELFAESNVATVVPDEEDDHVDDVMSWDEMVDTDGDGLPDYIEYEYGTDINNTDTDGDGLPDGYEVLNCGTDPALFDSDGNGISDADEDLDGDGLSNIEEYRLGTAPIVKDSDNDGLSDGEEVNIHNTDPLVYDSDSDGICDGDEIIKGLNPNNPATFGVPDSEYTFEQTLTADNVVFNLINYNENPFKLSLKFNAAGNAENSVAVSKSGYSIIMDNESILGCVPEIYYDKNLKVSNIEISFDISQEYLIEPYSASDDELTGLNKYNIFTYNEDLNMLMPVATEYDEVNNRIYTNVENVGTYFVVDMNNWISQLGIESDSESANVTAYSLSENADEESEYIDVAFLIYTDQLYLNVIKKQLTTTVEAMYSQYDNIRVFFVVYSGSAYVCGLTGNKYAESVEEANNIINRIFQTPDINNLTMVNGFKGVNDLEWRENSQRHCFVIDVLVEPMCKYDMPAFTALAEKNISTAICYGSANANAAIYKAMTPNTYANVVVIDRFLIPLIKFPTKMIMSTNLLPVKLDKDIKRDYVDAAADLYYNEDKRTSYSDFADTDNDGLYDFEEINFDTNLISFKDNDKVKLPTFAECLASTNNASIITAMDIYADKSFYEEVMNKNILLVNSDPTSEDGDGDGILDFDEVAIIKEELKSSTSAISTFSATAIKDSDGDGIPDNVEKKHKGTLDCTRKDTVKSIFEAIAASNGIDMGDTSNYTWISFDDVNDENHITLNVRMKYNEKLFNDDGTEEKLTDSTTGEETEIKFTVETVNKIAPDSKTNSYNTIMYDPNVPTSTTKVDISKLMSIKDVEKLTQDQINTLPNDFINKYNKIIKKLNKVSKYNKKFIDTNNYGIKSTTTMKNLRIKSTKQHWEMSNVSGTAYDFYPGMKISFSVKLRQYSEDNGGNYVNVFFNANKCGHSNVSGNVSGKLNSNDDDNCIKIMNIYQSTCDLSTVHSKFDNDCTFYFKTDSNGNETTRFKTIERIYNTYAHEFGHVAGLYDAYSNAKLNGGVEPVQQAEIVDKEMMNDNENVSFNDIEMILYRHANGSNLEYFVPYQDNNGKTYELSKAFRAPYIIYIDSNNEYYYCDTLNGSLNVQKIGNSAAYSTWKFKKGKETDSAGQKYEDQSWFKQLP